MSTNTKGAARLSFLGLRLMSLHSSLLAKFFSVFNIRLMLRIITNFAPKLYLTQLVWEIRAFQRLQIHLGRWARQDKAAQSGSNLNITCALLKMPKSFKLLERIFSLISCVCWRVHNNALHCGRMDWQNRGSLCSIGGREELAVGRVFPLFFPEKVKIFIIPAAVYNDTSLFKCIENVPHTLPGHPWY